MEENNKFYTNLFLGSALALFACFATYQITHTMLEGKNYVATIGSRTLSVAELNEKLIPMKKQYAAQTQVNFKTENGKKAFDEVKKQVMDEIIITKSLMEKAEQEKIVVTEEIVTQEINKIKAQNFKNNDDAFRKALQKNNVTENNLRKLIKERQILQKLLDKLFEENIKITNKNMMDFYNAKKTSFQDAEQVSAKHILVKDEATANKIIKDLEGGKEFDGLAREFSIDPGSKPTGGDLGFFPKGAMVPEFEKAAWELKQSEFTKKAIKTQFGYHIILRTGYKPPVTRAFEEVKDSIKKDLTTEQQKEFINKLKEETMKNTEVKFNPAYESYSSLPKKEEAPASQSTPQEEKK